MIPSSKAGQDAWRIDQSHGLPALLKEGQMLCATIMQSTSDGSRLRHYSPDLQLYNEHSVTSATNALPHLRTLSGCLHSCALSPLH